jgi:hypothetical protein
MLMFLRCNEDGTLYVFGDGPLADLRALSRKDWNLIYCLLNPKLLLVLAMVDGSV